MQHVELLQNLGLNEKEAKCYLALLPLNRATAYMVALRSGLKKPTAYVVLENLVNKGFVLKIPHQDKTKYIAKSPKECFVIAREKINAVQEALPELMAMQKEDDERVSIAYFEGMEGIEEMYDRMIKIMKQKPAQERNISGFYAHEQDTSEMLQDYWKNLNERFAKNSIRRSAITTKHETLEGFLELETLKKYGIRIKPLAQADYSSNISIEIYDNYTHIVSHRHLQGILIENPDIADVMSQIFHLVWKMSKEKAIG